MTLQEQRRNIKKLSYKALEREVFRYMKSNLVQIILDMQKNQLFVRSQGADGIQLGYYKKQKNKRKSPSEGSQYDMIFTGALKSGLKVKITLTYIELSSTPRHVSNLMNRDFWGTKNWFGLSNSHLDILINNFLADVAARKTKKVIQTGKWN